MPKKMELICDQAVMFNTLSISIYSMGYLEDMVEV